MDNNDADFKPLLDAWKAMDMASNLLELRDDLDRLEQQCRDVLERDPQSSEELCRMLLDEADGLDNRVETIYALLVMGEYEVTEPRCARALLVQLKNAQLPWEPVDPRDTAHGLVRDAWTRARAMVAG
jgi:hypothetical protein